MKYVLAVLTIFIITFSSCKKENENENTNPVEESVLDYMPLSVGNYWVYQRYICDSGELNCEEMTIDTNWIVKDSLVNNLLYFKLVGNTISGNEGYFLRDSGDYIVDLKGHIYFTHTDTVNIFNFQYAPENQSDTMYYWYYQLAKGQSSIEVPSGNYECLDMRGHFFRQQDEFNTDHTTHKLHSKDVGMVKNTGVFASNLKVLKQELIGYHIEPAGITP